MESYLETVKATDIVHVFHVLFQRLYNKHMACQTAMWKSDITILPYKLPDFLIPFLCMSFVVHSPMEEDPEGTIVFTTVGVTYYGFDVFSVHLPDGAHLPPSTITGDTRLTDGISVNFNAQFVDNDPDAITFVSERSGSAKIYTTDGTTKTKSLPSIAGSLFHDRPTQRNGRLYFASAHEPKTEPFKSWSAVYCTTIDTNETLRLTPLRTVDYSPVVSQSGEFVAVASYGSGTWKGDFHQLETKIVIFRPSDPGKRVAVCDGGWPTWSGDSTIFFHRKSEDGWWSIFRVDINLIGSDHTAEVIGSVNRVTPPGLHAFTPSAAENGKWIAVATRRKGRKHRHVEIFDLETGRFYPITEGINPNLHHYNPFFSSDSTRIGYHRFRGNSTELVVPHLLQVTSPITGIRMLRVHGTFASFSPDGSLIAVNGDFLEYPGLMVLKSDGSKRWTLLKNPGAFQTCWNPKEKGVVYTSLGPIFESSKTTVQIARVSFDPDDLDGRKENEVLTTDVTILTREETGNNAFPSCSPDGKHLVFRSGRQGGKNLYIVDAVNGELEENGGVIRRLTEGEWIDTMPHWSPLGDLIAFSSNRHNPKNQDVFSIYLVRPDGTGLRRVELFEPELANRERLNHVCFSPNGEWLLFTANFGAVNAEPVSLPNHFQPYGDLYICRVDGTGLRRLTCNAYENGTPTWYGGGGIETEFGRLSLAEGVGDPLKGQFDEPLWITCDI